MGEKELWEIKDVITYALSLAMFLLVTITGRAEDKLYYGKAKSRLNSQDYRYIILFSPLGGGRQPRNLCYPNIWKAFNWGAHPISTSVTFPGPPAQP